MQGAEKGSNNGMAPDASPRSCWIEAPSRTMGTTLTGELPADVAVIGARIGSRFDVEGRVINGPAVRGLSLVRGDA